MKVNEILSESMSDQELLKIAREVGEKMYGKSHSGFVFPSSPKVIKKGKLPTNFAYDTFQAPFKPSEKKGFDRSDQPFEMSDVDKDGLLYVIDSEEGVLVYTPVKLTKDQVANQLESLGYKLVSKIGSMQEWYPKDQEYYPGFGLSKSEHALLISNDFYRLEHGKQHQSFDTFEDLIAAAMKLKKE